MSEGEARRLAILTFLQERSEELWPSVAPLYASGDQDAGAQAYVDVKALDEAGLAEGKFALAGGSPTGIRARMTVYGTSYLQEVETRRLDKATRRWAARTSLLEFLYDQDATTAATARDVTSMSATPMADFFGERLSDRDLDEASAWLQRKALTDGHSVAEFDGPTRAWLTDDGLECAEDFACDIQRYNRPEIQVGDTFNVTGENVQVVKGDNAVQTMHLGATQEKLAEALQGIFELLRSQGTAGQDEEDELYVLAQQAAEDVLSDSPTGEPGHRFLAKVRAVAIAMLTPAATKALELSIQAAEHDLVKLVEAGYGQLG